MALYQYLRNHTTLAFNNDILLQPIIGDYIRAPASVLLRTVGLYALTHRENSNAMSQPVIITPEYLKVAPVYDCLFPFGNRDDNSFPTAQRSNDNLDKVIADNELGILIGENAPSAEHYRDFVNAPPGSNAGQKGVTALGTALPLNFFVVLAPPGTDAINISDENEKLTNAQLAAIYNDFAAPERYLPNERTFFDEVNAVHSLHKQLTRFNIKTLKDIQPEFDNHLLYISISSLNLATTLPIRISGNLELCAVNSWGQYTGSEEEMYSMISFRAMLRNNQPFNEGDARVFRDLYRLECIREPAALLTNAMFVDLAMLEDNTGYQSIMPLTLVRSNYVEVTSFTNIRQSMPMAFTGAVNATRSLWRDIINTYNTPIINNFIYYRYDYSMLSRVASDFQAKAKLVIKENNLLFNYIMWKADVNGNITNTLREVLNLSTQDNQQHTLMDNHWNLQAGNANTYQVIVPIIIGTITFEARFSGTALLQYTDIYITSFPLSLLNALLLEWYQVDIGLPPQQIEIGLSLRAQV